ADPWPPGEETALWAAPPLPAAGAHVFGPLSRQGVHPYRLHTACERDGCRICQGYLCGSGCKNEAAGVCLVPAVEHYDARVLTDCAALFLDADRGRVRRLVCLWRGRCVTFMVNLFGLAVGDQATATLLYQMDST